MISKFIIPLAIFFTAFICDAQNDSICVLHFVSTDTNQELPFTPLEINGKNITGAVSDAKGIIKLNKQELISGNTQNVCASYIGYNKQCLPIDELISKDSVVVRMETGPNFLDEIKIVAYRVPLIDKGQVDTRSEWEQIQDEEAGKTIQYTTNELEDFRYLKDGHVVMSDTSSHHTAVSSSGFYQYLDQIPYPKKAIDWEIQERIYVSFEIDAKGTVQEIELLKGTEPVLVLAAVNHLKKSPRIDLKEYSTYKNSKTIRFILPVRFVLE